MRSAKANDCKDAKKISFHYPGKMDKDEIAALCRPFPSYLANLG
jgi:hypothetical protein